MNMVGDMRQYTQFQAAESLPVAAANEGGGLAGAGAGLGAGLIMAQQMANALKPESAGGPEPSGTTAPQSPAGETKFCIECGSKMPGHAKFCPNCGTKQE
jgi:membrane protease subunit (stomatin/prohibitin family)